MVSINGLNICREQKKNYLSPMRPDYPHKPFNDKRMHYVLLIFTLAEDSRP